MGLNSIFLISRENLDTVNRSGQETEEANGHMMETETKLWIDGKTQPKAAHFRVNFEIC